MLSTALSRRFEAEFARYAGSQARVVFYSGSIPLECEEQARGERVADQPASEVLVRNLYRGIELPLPEGASYWRLLNNDGNVVAQGSGRPSAVAPPPAEPPPEPTP